MAPNSLACDPGVWPPPKTEVRELFSFSFWPLLTLWGWEAPPAPYTMSHLEMWMFTRRDPEEEGRSATGTPSFCGWQLLLWNGTGAVLKGGQVKHPQLSHQVQPELAVPVEERQLSSWVSGNRQKRAA